MEYSRQKKAEKLGVSELEGDTLPIVLDGPFSKLEMCIRDSIGSYIPTRSSIAILKRYWNIVSGKSGESASVLIGPCLLYTSRCV